MLCYKDATFCNFKACNKFNNCDNALTQKVQEDADEWWKGFKSRDKTPISVYNKPPKCYNKYE